MNWPTELVHTNSGAVSVLLHTALKNGRKLLAIL